MPFKITHKLLLIARPTLREVSISVAMSVLYPLYIRKYQTMVSCVHCYDILLCQYE